MKINPKDTYRPSTFRPFSISNLSKINEITMENVHKDRNIFNVEGKICHFKNVQIYEACCKCAKKLLVVGPNEYLRNEKMFKKCQDDVLNKELFITIKSSIQKFQNNNVLKNI